ncbi:hypothetical protein AKJ16_DCAP19897 [Drosera capensis]
MDDAADRFIRIRRLCGKDWRIFNIGKDAMGRGKQEMIETLGDLARELEMKAVTSSVNLNGTSGPIRGVKGIAIPATLKSMRPAIDSKGTIMHKKQLAPGFCLIQKRQDLIRKQKKTPHHFDLKPFIGIC